MDGITMPLEKAIKIAIDCMKDEKRKQHPQYYGYAKGVLVNDGPYKRYLEIELAIDTLRRLAIKGKGLEER